jgi:CRISPR-associated endonuclease Cas2
VYKGGKKKLNFLVCYDVPMEFTKERNKIAKVCKNFGLIRIQYSVFWGSLTTAEAKELALQAANAVGTIPVDIRFIAVCNECFGKCFTVIHNQELATSGVETLNANPLFAVLTHTTVGWDPNDRRVTGFPRTTPIRSQRNRSDPSRNTNSGTQNIDDSSPSPSTIASETTSSPEAANATSQASTNSPSTSRLSTSTPDEIEELPPMSFELPADLGNLSFDQMLELTGMKNLAHDPWVIPDLEGLANPESNHPDSVPESGKACRFDEWDQNPLSPTQPEFAPVEDPLTQEDLAFYEDSLTEPPQISLDGVEESGSQGNTENSLNENQNSLNENSPSLDSSELHSYEPARLTPPRRIPFHRGIADLDILII